MQDWEKNNDYTWAKIAEDLEGDETWEFLHRDHEVVDPTDEEIEVEVVEYEQEEEYTPSASTSYYFRDLRDEDFPPVVPERISNFTDDYYAFNWTEEEQLRRTILNHEVNEAPTNWRMLYRNGGIPYKTCYLCFVALPKTEYSKRQWSIGDDPRCNSCMKKCYQ